MAGTENRKVNRIPTSLDVAKAAGVSQSTVSRVLNRKALKFISPTTRRRVLKIAGELGYSPNPLAQALRKGKTNLIGIVLRDIDDPLFALLVSHLSIKLREHGYHLILINAHGDPQEALEMRTIIDARHTDGLIIMGDLLEGQEALQQVVSSNAAVVSLFRKRYPGIGSVVTVDSYRGIELGLRHITDLGHRRIGFLGYHWLDDTALRRDAFITLMKDAGKPIEPGWIQIGDGGMEGGYATMKAMLASENRPTAVIACDDMMAIGAVRAASDAGLSVPQDVSVVGFDDIPMSRYLTPALTTVRMPVEAISTKVCGLLMQFIGAAEAPPTRIYRVKPELIIRGSTGPRTRIDSTARRDQR
jgi:LacI family transcriptional regulator